MSDREQIARQTGTIVLVLGTGIIGLMLMSVRRVELDRETVLEAAAAAYAAGVKDGESAAYHKIRTEALEPMQEALREIAEALP